MVEKLKDCFEEMVVYKDLQKNNFFASLSLPSFLRDWLLKNFENENCDFNIEEIAAFINKFIPKEDQWMSIKNSITIDNERVKFLTKITVDINIATQEVSFSLPDYGLTNRETIIEPIVWDKYKDELVKGKETWGIIELGYRPPCEEFKQRGKIKLTGFQNFCPYTVDLDYYKDVRSEFSVDEWIDVLLGAIDYNSKGYEDNVQKLTMLTRLLPFVEKRLNLIELAPKGTGKSYLFGQVSKYGFISTGTITRAKMFYDVSKRQTGWICNNDYVALDEVQTATFSNMDEIRGAMKGYMESGTFSFGDYQGKADAGVILLGNIDQSNMNEYNDMLAELPETFHESALLDRFHGFIKGWDIPRMSDDLKVCGWALNSEYFCSILHLLRDDASYRAIVDQLIIVPEKSDTRDTEAVKRISTAYLKLLFPNVRKASDIDAREFRRYCLKPAIKMRGIIRTQLGILDTEFKGKSVPNFEIKDFS